MFGREAFDALDAGSLGTWFALLHNVILRNKTWGTQPSRPNLDDGFDSKEIPSDAPISCIVVSIEFFFYD